MPSLNWMILRVVGKNWEQPVQGERAVASSPRADDGSRPTSYSCAPRRKCCRVISNMRPTTSVVDTPAVRYTSLHKTPDHQTKFKLWKTFNLRIISSELLSFSYNEKPNFFCLKTYPRLRENGKLKCIAEQFNTIKDTKHVRQLLHKSQLVLKRKGELSGSHQQGPISQS